MQNRHKIQFLLETVSYPPQKSWPVYDWSQDYTRFHLSQATEWNFPIFCKDFKLVPCFFPLLPTYDGVHI